MDQRVLEIAESYASLQGEICRTLEAADGKAKFGANRWEKEIGSGNSCVISDGAAIQKGGVNFSCVHGAYTPKMEQLLGFKASQYAVTGISSIMHPVNPLAPIIHMNVRFFSLDGQLQWFGGGIDLTPHYVDPQEATAFHRELKKICDGYHAGFYPRFKAWADDYFFLPHRNETRGVGGIFFDRLQPGDPIGFDSLFAFTRELALAYAHLYAQILAEKGALPYSPQQKEWQELRRGRYAEFNLLHDRGTKFGFDSNGNTESILVSMPPTSAWVYLHQTLPGSAEEQTLRQLRKGVDWINLQF